MLLHLDTCGDSVRKQGLPEPHMYAPYMTVYLVVSLPVPFIHRICMVLANPIHTEKEVLGFLEDDVGGGHKIST